MPTLISPLAGKPAPRSLLVDVPRLVTGYYTGLPDPTVQSQRVAFGTSGHRGSSLDLSFNEQHVQAITQAICQYRQSQEITGPLFLGIDTHALSQPACSTALEVLAANGVDVMLATNDDYTPTPAVSHAILAYNRGRTSGLADGIVVTPSHNPRTMAASSTTRPTVALRVPTSQAASRPQRTASSRLRLPVSSGCPMRKHCTRRRHTAMTSSTPMSPTSAM